MPFDQHLPWSEPPTAYLYDKYDTLYAMNRISSLLCMFYFFPWGGGGAEEVLILYTLFVIYYYIVFIS